MYFPFVLMIITGYFLFKYYKKNKGKIKDNLSEEETLIWEKAKVGLYFTIPLILIIISILHSISERKSEANIGPAILNFFITRFVVKKIIKKGLSFNYPKLYTIGISIVIYIIQLTLGTVMVYLLKI